MKNEKTETILNKYGDISPLVLSSQIRYNNRIRLKDEDLAQHSYYVCYNIVHVGYEYNIDDKIVQEAVCRAIFHDMDEQFTSDIPHDCKVEYPELKKMVTEIGYVYMQKRAPFAIKYFNDYISKDDIATVLVAIGDAISVLQYTNRETSLGNNTAAMQEISNEVRTRVIKLLADLEERLCKNDNNSRGN